MQKGLQLDISTPSVIIRSVVLCYQGLTLKKRRGRGLKIPKEHGHPQGPELIQALMKSTMEDLRESLTSGVPAIHRHLFIDI